MSERMRALPWVAIAQGTMVLARRWRALSAKDRARLGRLVRSSAGRPSNLDAKERAQLRAILAKLDLAGVGRELSTLPRRRRRARRRRRGPLA
jgi:hypothetical protein